MVTADNIWPYLGAESRSKIADAAGRDEISPIEWLERHIDDPTPKETYVVELHWPIFFPSGALFATAAVPLKVPIGGSMRQQFIDKNGTAVGSGETGELLGVCPSQHYDFKIPVAHFHEGRYVHNCPPL